MDKSSVLISTVPLDSLSINKGIDIALSKCYVDIVECLINYFSVDYIRTLFNKLTSTSHINPEIVRIIYLAGINESSDFNVNVIPCALRVLNKRSSGNGRCSLIRLFLLHHETLLEDVLEYWIGIEKHRTHGNEVLAGCDDILYSIIDYI